MKQNYLFFFVLFFLCKSIAFTQIVNKGILKIQSGTEVYFGNEYTNDGTHNNEGNLHLKNNFVNNGTTTLPTSGTTYFTSSTAIQEIKGSVPRVNFYNLVINNTFPLNGVSVADADLTAIPPVYAIELNVVNTVTLTNGDLRLVGEAQLIQTHTGTTANSATNGKLLRDQQGISSKFGYNYWSSPVTTTASLPRTFKLDDGLFGINGGLFDGTDASTNPFAPALVFINPAVLDGSATTPITISERWLYTYSPNNLGYAGWDKIDKSSAINPGEGFTMKGTGVTNQNYIFKGVPNDGDYSFTIATGQSALLGNPYPSALDSEKFIKDNISAPTGTNVNNVIDGNIYFWVDGGSSSHYLAAYVGAYAIQNLTGIVSASVPSGIAGPGSSSGADPLRYIAVAQGFFVDGGNDGGDIVFNNSQRTFKTETSGESSFFKNSYSKENDVIKNADLKSYIRIGYEDPEKFHRQLLLGFLSNSTADLNFNYGYDALMFSPREDELFFIIENDLTKKYVIQGVNAFDENNEFDLGLMMTEAGVHTIMLDAVENFTGKVYIKDVLANITYDLTKGSFCPNLPPGTYLDRFKLVFTDKTATVVTEDLNPDFGIAVEKTTVYYHENESLIVRTKNDLKVNNITVYNTLGQQIKQINNAMLGKNVFAIPFHYPIGVYLIIVESELGKETFNIINK